MDEFEYINRTYGLEVKRGSRVEFTGGPNNTPRLGTVVGARGAYVNISFDDHPSAVGPFHPTWELRYLEPEAQP